MNKHSWLKRFVFAALLLSCYTANAQESNAENELALLENILPNSCHFSGNFLQEKDITGLPMPLRSEGDFFFSCGLGLIWNSSLPFEEILLFANSATHFKIDENGEISPLSGTIRYGMSRIFLRLLKGDSQYFADEFSVSLLENGVTQLIPESDFMKKGIESIQIIKLEDNNQNIQLQISILDATGQTTKVTIDGISEYELDSKQAAFEQCELVYAKPRQWCRMLRSPWRYQD